MTAGYRHQCATWNFGFPAGINTCDGQVVGGLFGELVQRDYRDAQFYQSRLNLRLFECVFTRGATIGAGVTNVV